MLHAWWFAVGGLVLAAGPVAIHLLNRQRYRVVYWAAMDFLRQAIRRSRRLMRLQDILLMLLRSLCVLLFGLAMARPYFTRPSAEVYPDQPVHAVLAIDNSLSMGYERLGGTFLDGAKARAKEFVGRLPPGSRISVLPACGSAGAVNPGAYSTKEDAIDAINAVSLVDRSAKAAAVLDLAQAACRRIASPSTKQIIFLSDQQAINWPQESLAPQIEKLAGLLQLVQVGASGEENAWISDFRLQDGIADVQTPAVFLATVRFQGLAPRRVQVMLSIEGMPFAPQTVELQPGQAKEIRFPAYRFSVPVQPGQVTFVRAEVAIEPHDHLAADDRRVLAVPVVAALPVVFVDQLGPDEDPKKNWYGETFRLRRLLAPEITREERAKQLVQVRHLKPERLSLEQLRDARLVVVAGLPKPPSPPTLSLLRQYVEQGGSLVLAAGGDFNPGAWTQAAYGDGLGILPAPLKPAPIGTVPGLARGQTLKAFQLDFNSLIHEYFVLEQTSREELEELYRLPYFFKAVEADTSDGTVEKMVGAVAAQIEKDRKALADVDQRLAELNAAAAKASDGASAYQDRMRLENTREQLQPQWLLWARSVEAPDDQALSPQELAERGKPRILGSYTNQVPFLIERQMGRGRVLFLSTGVFRDWNTLTATNAALVFDRIFRDLLARTLPKRNLTTTERLVIPVPPEMRSSQFTLTDPAGNVDRLSVDALGGDRYGLILTNLVERGFYRVSCQLSVVGRQSRSDNFQLPTDNFLLAVNGPAEESELAALDAAGLQARMTGAEYRWVPEESSIRLAAGADLDQDLWKWVILAVFAVLAVESAILAWPHIRGGQTFLSASKTVVRKEAGP
jgi:hypothetical protein